MESLRNQLETLSNKAKPKDLVVFAGRLGGRLLDNVKYLFLHCVRQKQPFTFVFLTHYKEEHRCLKKLGMPSVLFPSEEALLLLPKARLVVADDFWWKTQTQAYHLLTNAKTVQIWHGIPLKLIGFPEIESGVNMTPDKISHLEFGYSGYDAAVSTSPYVTETSLGKVFKSNAMWETGYPRNDVLLREPDSMDLLGVDTDALARARAMQKTGHKIVFFMPTFRDTGGDPFSDGVLNPSDMDEFGRKRKIVFALKFHPYIKIEADLGLKNVFLIRSDTDAYPLLRYADCLLTDYSSVAYDFLLTGRPQVFLPYDLEKYLSRDRGMFYSFETMAPGPKPTNQADLFTVLESILVHGQNEHADERKQLTSRLFTYNDGYAAQRIIDRMIKTFFSKH